MSSLQKLPWDLENFRDEAFSIRDVLWQQKCFLQSPSALQSPG